MAIIPCWISNIHIKDESRKGKRRRTYNSSRIQTIIGVKKKQNRPDRCGYLIVLENKSAIGYYLERIMKDTTMKQQAYGSLGSSEMQAEPVDQLVNLKRRAVLLRHFEEGNRATTEVHALIAIL